MTTALIPCCRGHKEQLETDLEQGGLDMICCVTIGERHIALFSLLFLICEVTHAK